MSAKSIPIRLKLSLWAAALLGFILVLFCATALWFSHLGMRQEFDRYLAQEYAYIERHLETDNAGAVYVRKSHSSPTTVELLQQQPRWIEVWSASGELLLRELPIQGAAIGSKPLGSPSGASISSIKANADVSVRFMEGPMTIKGRDAVIRVGLAETRLWAQTKQMLFIFLALIPAALILAAAAGYFLVRKSLRPVDLITSKAEAISADNLKSRLPVVNPDDELGRLATVLNRLLDRIERSFSQLKRFTSDASHELRTPLTALRSVGEVALQQPQSADYYRAVIESNLEEVDRLTKLVGSLLDLSRADAGTVSLDAKEFDLRELTQSTIELLSPLAEEKKQTLELLGKEDAQMRGDPMVMKQVLINLIDNAIKHCGPKATIQVRIDRDAENYVSLEVKDNGPGISREHQPHIFDRFYRVDPSRNQGTGGAGLGLSIVKWAVEAHGGRISVSSVPGEGTNFQIMGLK